MARMPSASYHQLPDHSKVDEIRISLLNVRSLDCHHAYIVSNKVLTAADIVELTETWLTKDASSDKYMLHDFNFLPQHKSERKGLVAAYCRMGCYCQPIAVPTGLNSIAFKMADVIVILVYRPPTQKMSDFDKEPYFNDAF